MAKEIVVRCVLDVTILVEDSTSYKEQQEALGVAREAMLILEEGTSQIQLKDTKVKKVTQR